MRKSLREAERIEAYLSGTMPETERIIFRARLDAEPEFRQSVRAQQETYATIRAYARRQLRAELEAIHGRLLRSPKYPSFRRALRAIFGAGI